EPLHRSVQLVDRGRRVGDADLDGGIDVGGRAWGGHRPDDSVEVEMNGPDESPRSPESATPEHVRWLTEPNVHDATLVCAFTGWNDAGDAASQAAQVIIEQWRATPVAEIDPELFTDFGTVRPHVRLDEFQQRHIVWPTAGVWTVNLPGTDVVILL